MHVIFQNHKNIKSREGVREIEKEKEKKKRERKETDMTQVKGIEMN